MGITESRGKLSIKGEKKNLIFVLVSQIEYLHWRCTESWKHRILESRLHITGRARVCVHAMLKLREVYLGAVFHDVNWSKLLMASC